MSQKISIPFRPFFSQPMRDGIKVMTCRTKKMGKPGDWFDAFQTTFVLTHVMRMPLEYVLEDCWAQEGCQSQQELIGIWRSIHPRSDVDPEQIVWAHCFRLTNGTP